MSNDAPVIVWFRRDLRLADNPALLEAAGSGKPLIALYILDETPTVRPLGAASLWWLDKSLAALEKGLRGLGAHLILRRGVAQAALAKLVAETGADTLHWNRLYDADSIRRDTAIKDHFKGAGVSCRSFNAALLNEPWDVAGATGSPFRVFGPYWRAAQKGLGAVQPTPSPCRLKQPKSLPRSERLADWGLHPAAPDWSVGFSEWVPGEAGAEARLDEFMDRSLADYAGRRNRPDMSGTSSLSPHLAFGEIGPRQVWAAIQSATARRQASHVGLESFLGELGWREFNYHLLFHNPEMTTKNFKSKFDALPWRDDPVGLDAWRRGATGYPLVDAGMRQLWATGWMHNRVRMIAASFLIKDLMIDWRAGEAWFWDTLVDADIANNVANWQWVAGTGADAAPYFRVFNPALQGETHDPDGAYVRRWIPELAKTSGVSRVHQPWREKSEVLAEAGARPGLTYPAPIVDHAKARERALDAYGRLG